MKLLNLKVGFLLMVCLISVSGQSQVTNGVEVNQRMIPVLNNKSYNEVLQISIDRTNQLKNIHSFDFELTAGQAELIKNIHLFYVKGEGKNIKKELFGEIIPQKKKFRIKGVQELKKGKNNFVVAVQLNENVDLTERLAIRCKKITSDKKKLKVNVSGENQALRLGTGLRQHNDDGVDTYRIPGLATTNKGTLIGVYDIRYNSGVDLQEDIDVGMNRSTDGGQTWEPMKIIMDMGEWGGKPDKENGIGDPSVLVDRSNNTIWVAAVWAHGHPGERNWWASKPGLTPQKTSQFILVKSEDDGVTWSEPINITNQIKKPE